MAIEPGRVKPLFQEAIERDDPYDRRAFVYREAGGDAELIARLDALLAAYNRPPIALDRPLGANFQATADSAVARPDPKPSPVATRVEEPTVNHRIGDGVDRLDDVIAGRYKLRQEIGEGGMGTVHLAEQTQPVKRQVALKLIKPGRVFRQLANEEACFIA